MPRKSDNKQQITNQTQIGSVTGQVHSGSGDINVTSFVSGAIANKEDFLTALSELRMKMGELPNGLPENIAKDALAEISKAEEEGHKKTPAANDIAAGLRKAKQILLAGVGAASATGGAIAAVEKLIPSIQSAIDHVPKLFGL
jgi:hypothetical protein